MLNSCNFIGHLGKDPEIRSTQAGKRIASLSVAVSERWKDKAGEKQERTEWVRVAVFNEGLVGVVEKFLKKGAKVFVSGKLQTSTYDKDGETRYSTEIILSGFDAKLVMLDSKSGNESTVPVEAAAIDHQAPLAAEEDSVPF